MIPNNLAYGAGLTVSNTHINSIDVVAPGTKWFPYCIDTTWQICADVIAGPIVDNFAVASPNVAAGLHGSTVGATFMYNSFYIAGIAYEAQGEGYTKVPVSANLTSDTSGTTGGIGETNEILNNQFNQVSYMFWPIAVQYPGGVNASMSWHDIASGTLVNTTYELFQTNINGRNSAVVGANPGMGLYSAGVQYGTSTCWYDVPGLGQTHSTNRFCLKGGPNLTGVAAGWEHDIWNTSTLQWVAASYCSPDATNTTQDDCTFTGNLNVGGTFTGNFGTTQAFNNITATGATVGPASIASLSNYALWSGNPQGASWSVLTGTTPTYATSQLDANNQPTATEITGSGSVELLDANAPTSLPAATSLNVCIEAKGATGTETITLGAGQFGVTVPLSPSWQYICRVVSGGTTHLNYNAWFAMPVAESIYFDGISTTLATNSSAYLQTQGTAQPTPTPGISVAGNPVPVATTSTPSGTCTANGYVPMLVNGATVHVATCQ
jgi:hypothetical protein